MRKQKTWRRCRTICYTLGRSCLTHISACGVCNTLCDSESFTGHLGVACTNGHRRFSDPSLARVRREAQSAGTRSHLMMFGGLGAQQAPMETSPSRPEFYSGPTLAPCNVSRLMVWECNSALMTGRARSKVRRWQRSAKRTQPAASRLADLFEGSWTY